MAVKAHKLGPGTLTLGETASEQEFGTQVTRAEVSPSWADEDPIPVLSGDEYSEPGEFEGTLNGEFLQEYGMASLIAWTWEHTGEWMPFRFKPRNDAEMLLTGEVRVTAVTVGGDVKSTNTSEFEWPIRALPAMTFGEVGS